VGEKFTRLDEHLKQVGVFIVEHGAHRHVYDGLVEFFEYLVAHARLRDERWYFVVVGESGGVA